ncbi:MAG: type II toxin-antitoxin system RelE/ParE family toxin [Dyadobacter sp.]|uniref:type II toxin-antitoxin system RelE/ParE family toxin n=1 Tax=Dyadobacter sp. TaxID=1914288 RepID=UPI003263CBEE
MKLIYIFTTHTLYPEMIEKLFDIIMLEEAFDFLKSIDKKHSEKILYNIRKAQTSRDPELFKKLTNEIWEFRTLYRGSHCRLLAFWDKSNTQQTLVISTHGFVKKQSRVPDTEIGRALQIRDKYFQEKEKSNNETK